MTSSIALLSPYYGAFPKSFPFYVNGLIKNPNIHVYMFTDCFYDGYVPENLHIIESSMEHFKLLVKNKLGINSNIKKSYKLCDFRPAYGVIFEDYIAEYDYWAMGDIDVIYGDVLSNFPENWQDYDVLSMVPEWLSGSFSVFKNLSKINNLYKSSCSWEVVFSSEENFAFDECNCLYEQLRQGENILDIDDKESFTFLVKKSALNGDLKVWFEKRLIKEKIFGDKDFIRVSEGKVYKSDGQELAYYHMVSEKIRDRFVIPEWQKIPKNYFITSHGIISNTRFWHKKVNFYRVFVLFRSLYRDGKQFGLRSINKLMSLWK
jgi:hypothetical protein